MSSSAEVSSLFGVPVAALQYRDMANGSAGDDLHPDAVGARSGSDRGKRRTENQISEAEMAAKIRQERAEAAQQVEQKLRQEYEQKLEATRSAVAASVSDFALQREEYFARVEAEIVQLSLSIASRILHREAQVDPMLVASLVRVAIEKMREGSSVTVRVGAGRSESWRKYFAAQPSMAHVEVVEDAELNAGDCILETELGSANFSMEAQLKEVERGFFDLLALRPAAR